MQEHQHNISLQIEEDPQNPCWSFNLQVVWFGFYGLWISKQQKKVEFEETAREPLSQNKSKPDEPVNQKSSSRFHVADVVVCILVCKFIKT